MVNQLYKGIVNSNHIGTSHLTVLLKFSYNAYHNMQHFHNFNKRTEGQKMS